MRKRRSPRRSYRHAARPVACSFERIEPRLLLACDFSITDGTLMVTGDGSSQTLLVAEVMHRVSVVCDGETRTFDGVDSVVIDLGTGDDVVSFQGSTDGGIGSLKINTGGGNNRVDVNFASGEGEAQPARALRVAVNAGAGADRVEIKYDERRDGQELDVELSVDPGGVGTAAGALPEVDDEVLVAFENGDVGNRLYVGNLSWHSLNASETRLPAVQASATFRANTSLEKPLFAFTVIGLDGRDEVKASGLLLPAVQTAATAVFHLDLGGGDNGAEIRFGDGVQGSRPPSGSHTIDATYRAGDGDNNLLIGLLVPAMQKVRDASAQIDVQVGGGNNKIGIGVDGFDDVGGRVDAGDGNDAIDVKVNGRPAALADIITGAGPGAGPHVKVFDAGGGDEARSFFAYGSTFSGGVRVAAGDVNGDGTADIITGAGPGHPGGHVKVFDGGTGAELASFLAFPGFTGGVYVASGDVNGDGRDDVIVGADAGAPGGHVRVFDGVTFATLDSFFAYDTGFAGGVRVAAGDVNGDGFDDIITGAGSGAPGGHIKIFDGATRALLGSFLAYDGGFLGGVYVASGDVNGDGRDDIVTGAGAGPAGHVKVFDGARLNVIHSFFAYDASFAGGVRVAAGDVNGDGFADILTGAGPGAGPHVKSFDGRSLALLHSFFAYDPTFTGGVFVASGDVTGSPRDPASLNLTVDTGGGNDEANVHTTGIDQITALLDAGAGDDAVSVGATQTDARDSSLEIDIATGEGNDDAHFDADGKYALTGVQHWAKNVRASFDLGSGDDALTLRSDGVDNLRLHVGAGDGDDRIEITALHREPNAAPGDVNAIEVVAQLGLGNDTLLLNSDGYNFIKTDMDTGPLGDGTDLVSGSHVAPFAVKPTRRVIRPLDRGADMAIWHTVGSFSVLQDSHPSSTRQIVVLRAT